MLSLLRPLPEAPPVTDAGAVDAFYKRARLRLLISLTLIYGFYYTCRIGLSVVKKPLIDAGIFNAKELGQIGAFLLGAYAFGKLANGVFADRVNIQRFLPLGLFLSALANLAMGSNTAFVVACVLWAMNGYFQGVGATASVVSLTQWFSARERGTVYGIWSAAHSIGEGITFIGTSVLVAHFGWRAGFLTPAVACVIVAGIGLAVLFDRPAAYGLPPVWQYKGDPHEQRHETTWSAQLDVLKSGPVWVCAVASALMYVTRYAVNNWGVLYLQESRGPAVGARAPVAALAKTIRERAEALTATAWRHGMLERVDPRVSATAVVGAAEAMVFRALSGDELGAPAEVAAALIELMLNGVASRRAASFSRASSG